MLLGLNIGKNAATPIERAVDDYLICLDGVYPHADYVTVNISSPNTANLRALQSDEALDALLARGRAAARASWQREHGQRVPLFVKIAPDLDEAQVERDRRHAAAARHGRRDRHQHHAGARRGARACRMREEAGGLSGAPVLRGQQPRDRASCARRWARAIPIIGVGGVLSAADAVAKIEAGADWCRSTPA